MKQTLLTGKPYVNAASTTPEYLRAKFKRIERELAKKKTSVARIQPRKEAA
jgi:hypothetical protein